MKESGGAVHPRPYGLGGVDCLAHLCLTWRDEPTGRWVVCGTPARPLPAMTPCCCRCSVVCLQPPHPLLTCIQVVLITRWWVGWDVVPPGTPRTVTITTAVWWLVVMPSLLLHTVTFNSYLPVEVPPTTTFAHCAIQVGDQTSSVPTFTVGVEVGKVATGSALPPPTHDYRRNRVGSACNSMSEYAVALHATFLCLIDSV